MKDFPQYTTFVNKLFVLCLLIILSASLSAQAQQGVVLDDKTKVYSDPLQLYKNNVDYSSFRRAGIHDGNLIRSAFSNFGNLGSRTIDIRLEWPKGSGTNYGFEFIFFVGAEVIDARGDTIHIFTDNYTGGPRDQAPDASHTYGWEPLPGYYNDGEYVGGISEDLNNNGELDPGEDVDRNGKLTDELYNDVEYPAMSHLPQTWPTDWPLGSYPGETGSRKGLWNGEYGAYVRADQESYYLMDDRNNDEFLYYPFVSNPQDTLPWPDGRRGIGLEVETRNYQWADVMAEDIIISIYQVKNVSEKNLPKCVLGMYIDADVGTSGPSSDAGDDASSFDTREDITYQWDLDGLSAKGKPTGHFGFAFLQSPGIANDGLDNDENGIIDESQENGVDDDGDWRAFSDDNGNGVWDWEDLNNNGLLDEGEDADGDGILDIEDLNDDLGQDGLGPLDTDWPGLGVDPLEGNGVPDVPEPNYEYTDNDEIDQIGLTSFFGTSAGDVLSADEEAWYVKSNPGTFTEATGGLDVAFHYACGYFHLNQGFTERFAIACLVGNDEDDLFRNKRTMQEIYDHDYNFKKPPLEPTILAAIPGDRRVTLIWDDRAERSRDPVYERDFGLYKIYRSTDPAFNDIKTVTDAFGNPVLWEPIAQFDYADGLTGAHPIAIGETGAHYDMGSDSGLRHTFIDTSVENGRTYYYAVVSVDKGYDSWFYEKGVHYIPDLLPTWPSECGKVIQTDISGNVISHGRNCAVVVPSAPASGYSYPKVAGAVEHVSGYGSGSVDVSILLPDEVEHEHRYAITFTDTMKERFTNTYTITDITSPDSADHEILYSGPANFNPAVMDMRIMDGFAVNIQNDSVAVPDESGWKFGNSTLVGDVQLSEGSYVLAAPYDYEVRIMGPNADTTYEVISRFRIPVNFQVWNTTLNRKEEFSFTEFGIPDSAITPKDNILIIANRVGRRFDTTWDITFYLPALADTIMPEEGDVFYFTTKKPFTSDDVFEFSTEGWGFTPERAKNDLLNNVYVVPDPYVAVNSVEKPIFNVRGRGERRIDFVHLPMKCTIKIFTINGKLVQTLEHDSPHNDGSESWNLVTKDGLDVAWGTYFYHIDAPGIGEKVGKFAIIR
ncbi:hypothetical protein GF337_04855 [candidate division KSB1 bacterium]|nr:hypothetical protein [candidate division KSB1 bacterium]